MIENNNIYIDEHYHRVICPNCEIPTDTEVKYLKKVGGNAQITCKNCNATNLYILARKLIGSREYEPREQEWFKNENNSNTINSLEENKNSYEDTSKLKGFEF